MPQPRERNHSIWFRAHLLVIMLDQGGHFTFDGLTGIHLDDPDVQRLLRQKLVTLKDKVIRLTTMGKHLAKVYWSDFHPDEEDPYFGS